MSQIISNQLYILSRKLPLSAKTIFTSVLFASDQQFKQLIVKSPIQVYLVDGEWVRDTKEVQFIGGGHHLWSPVIPNNEIWIENNHHARDESEILIHELIEFHLMKHLHWTYDKAHDFANSKENLIRHGHDPIKTLSDFVEDQLSKEQQKETILSNMISVYQQFVSNVKP